MLGIKVWCMRNSLSLDSLSPKRHNDELIHKHKKAELPYRAHWRSHPCGTKELEDELPQGSSRTLNLKRFRRPGFRSCH